MNVDCPYYREHRRSLRQDEGAAGDSVTWITVPYCLHKHSPAPLHRIANIPNGWLVLTCGGSVDHCQIAMTDHLDID